MPSWNELVNDLESLPTADDAKNKWIQNNLSESLNKVSACCGGTNVIFYASAFLQKPQLPPQSIQLTNEEINGFMSIMHGMDWEKGLTLLIHTPGGVTNAAETIVSYLHEKFVLFETIVPTFAMSAGTMIALGSNKIIMGRQSQLGPIDPQMPFGGRTVSALAIVDQFERAKKDLLEELKLAHLWAPILQSLGPGLLQEAQNALDYSEIMVAGWLQKRMFANYENSQKTAEHVASYFNKAPSHKSHGCRIDRENARAVGVIIEDLENNQELQEAVITAYHITTIIFEKSPASKLLISNKGRQWIKNFNPIQVPVKVSGPFQQIEDAY